MNRLEIAEAKAEDDPFLMEMVILSLRSLPQLAKKSRVELEGMARLEIGSWEAGRDCAFVARSNYQRAGAVWLKAHGESLAQHYELGIAVLPEFQHQGIGTRLMEHALEFCKHHTGSVVSLKLFPGNLPALRLYRRFGFEEVTLEMRKKL